tara:strand:- start:1595 stop:2395 length:801 start_codon:yes stop_codon:yes gene_type:complete
MKRLERFQNNNYSSGNESLNSAYSGESLNIISNNSVFDLGENTTTEENTAANTAGGPGNDFHQHIELEDAKFDFNIWDLLGVKSLGEDKHNCLFDCAIKSTHSLEQCNNTNQFTNFFFPEHKEKCKVSSYKEALQCSKACYNLPQNEEYVTPDNLLTNETQPVTTQPTTQPIPTTTPMPTQPMTTSVSIDSKLRFNSREVPGLMASINNFSPYDSKYWPSENQFGWNTDEIVDYNNSLGDEVIEVRAKQFFPSSTDAPFLEFKNLG